MTSTNTEICGICRDELVSDIKTLSCNHVFHTKCIDAWIARHPKCPFCRTRVVYYRTRLDVSNRLKAILPRGNIATVERIVDIFEKYGSDPYESIDQLIEQFNIPTEDLLNSKITTDVFPDGIVVLIHLARPLETDE